MYERYIIPQFVSLVTRFVVLVSYKTPRHLRFYYMLQSLRSVANLVVVTWL